MVLRLTSMKESTDYPQQVEGKVTGGRVWSVLVSVEACVDEQ